MAKKKKVDFEAKAFESKNPNSEKTYTRIYVSMLNSKSFLELSNGAKVIYLYMKSQYFSNKKVEVDGLILSQEYFYFNYKMYSEVLGICKNRNQFIKHKQELIEHGFIEEFASGKQSRTKTIYRYSDKWQNWEPEEN